MPSVHLYYTSIRTAKSFFMLSYRLCLDRLGHSVTLKSDSLLIDRDLSAMITKAYWIWHVKQQTAYLWTIEQEFSSKKLIDNWYLPTIQGVFMLCQLDATLISETCKVQLCWHNFFLYMLYLIINDLDRILSLFELSIAMGLSDVCSVGLMERAYFSKLPCYSRFDKNCSRFIAWWYFTEAFRSFSIIVCVKSMLLIAAMATI